VTGWQRGLTDGLNLSNQSLVRINVESWVVVRDIAEYRNALLHFPVLGRAHYLNAEFLPTKRFLPKDERAQGGRRPNEEAGWRALQKLTPADFIEGRSLLVELRAELLKTLRDAWRIICEAADEASLKREYRDLYNLDEQYHIRGGAEAVDDASARERMPDFSSPPASGFVQVVGSAVVQSMLSSDPPAKPKP